MRPCAHCGELYDDGRPNCPHCGADADLTYADDSYDPEFAFDPKGFDPEGEQGLAPAPPPSRPRQPGVAWIVVFVAAAVGLALAMLYLVL